MANEIVSKDPASDASLGGMLRNVFSKMLKSVDGMLPATVVSYDRVRNRAVIQPNISLLTTSGERVDRAPLASIPVLAIGGGGFLVNFPLKPGDTGWIEASDRDISLYMQSGRNAQPNTERLHSFSDGRFIPDVMGKYTIAGEDASAMVIQNTAGTVRVSLRANEVEITSPTVRISSTTTIINGIPFETHKHTGVQTGGGTSGGPTA